MRIDAKGKKGTVLNLSAPGQDAYTPQVATAPNGTSTIIWGAPDVGIQAVRIDAEGKKGPILNLSAPGQIRILPSGRNSGQRSKHDHLDPL